MVTCTGILKNHIHHDTWNIFFIGSQIEELEHSGLARQVSVLLTNHLARATECIGNEAAGTEALQDVLSLLNTLARSRMGRAILSQPACVSKLLSLLLDQRYARMISGVARLSVWIARQNILLLLYNFYTNNKLWKILQISLQKMFTTVLSCWFFLSLQKNLTCLLNSLDWTRKYSVGSTYQWIWGGGWKGYS